MFEKSALYYDLIYSTKDYRGEARRLRALLPEGARSLLDVGCGTGEHHRFLPDLEIHGLDLNPDLLQIARLKNPTADYIEGDMRGFALGRTFDVVTCLFSAIGYCQSLLDLVHALKCMAEHLAPNGLMMVEPWLTPDVWQGGRIYSDLLQNESMHVCRMSHSRRAGHLSVVDFHYLVGETGKGVRSFAEQHVMGLYTPEEMAEAFQQAGLISEYDETGLTGRGLYTARHASDF